MELREEYKHPDGGDSHHIDQKTKKGVKGKVKVFKSKIQTPEAQDLQDRIQELFDEGEDERAREKLDELHEKFGELVFEGTNIVPTVGFEVLTKGLSANLGSLAEIEVNIHAIGDDSTSPVSGDTQLGNEIFRDTVDSLTWSNDKFFATAFYAAGDFDATVHEHAFFINGTTGNTNSGTLWSRVLLNQPSGIQKSGTETLTIDYEADINNA